MTPEVVLAFPLRGEWMAINTPAHEVPSHGTDYFGQRYAYDFARSEPGAYKFLRPKAAWHLFAMVDASEFYCWNAPVHSAGVGRVIEVGDGWPDRRLINAFWQSGRMLFFQAQSTIHERDYRPLTGNYVMIEGEGGIALYAHLRHGSIVVRHGQTVTEGDVIGNVGNSGNSTMPHLHFQVMSGADPLTAQGVACGFRGYERLENGAWVKEPQGVPGRLERIRA